MQFFKDKFEFLVVTVVLSIVMTVWVASNYRPDVKEFLIAVFGAWLAVLRIVQKPNITTDTLNTGSLDSANTEQGDIISETAPKTITKKGE